MQRYAALLIIAFFLGLPWKLWSQPKESRLGAWYMYFWNTTFEESNWGLQGDIQYRNWDLIGDLEQLLLRGGLTYQPDNTSAKFTLGYANIGTGEYGDGGDIVVENRLYQEALLSQQIGERVYLTHRFRYEQRFVENQDFRTRYRYNIFVNIPLNQTDLLEGAVYLALYNELFINGQRSIGDGRMVELFDRNRTYTALGYSISNTLRVQAGWMRQITDNWSKSQVQLSAHHTF